jgi:hypothetical protein
MHETRIHGIENSLIVDDKVYATNTLKFESTLLTDIKKTNVLKFCIYKCGSGSPVSLVVMCRKTDRDISLCDESLTCRQMSLWSLLCHRHNKNMMVHLTSLVLNEIVIEQLPHGRVSAHLCVLNTRI